MNTEYASPVSQLLTLGNPDTDRRRDYRTLGLGTEHVPALTQLALDTQFDELESERPELWARVHAWRALAQLHAVDAAEPLTQLFRLVDDPGDDWVAEDLTEALGQLGQPVIPVLRSYLTDNSHGVYARATASNALVAVAEQQPETRAECAAAIAEALEQFGQNDEGLNAMLAADLVQLKAVEYAPVIERAYAAHKVDEGFMGDWEDVQVKLGLKDKREHPRQRSNFAQWFGTPNVPVEPALARDASLPVKNKAASDKARAKARRKQAKKSRQKNRRRR